MSTQSYAFTLPVNPPGTSHPLSAEQLWAALLLKVRSPQLFVPAIKSCKVLSDEGSRVEREAFFASAPDQAMREIVTWDNGSLVEFLRVGDESKVTNVLSYGEGGELFLTYGFHGVPPSEPVKKIAPGAVKETIDVARKMVQEGKI